MNTLQYQCVFDTPLIRQPLRAATFPRGGRLWRVRLTFSSKQSFTAWIAGQKDIEAVAGVIAFCPYSATVFFCDPLRNGES